jgi:hypothetical protein
MEHSSKKGEKFLYEIWKNREFQKELETSDGDSISILDTGEENTDLSGPDFKNARIRIGNLIYVGDIEIDSDISDWKSHGHNIDKNYTKVILHLALNNKHNQHFVYNKNGRKIPSVCLNNFLDKSLFEDNDPLLDEEPEDINRLKCFEKNQLVDEKLKVDLIYELGLGRYQKKCSRIYNRLKELTFLNGLGVNEPVIKYDLTQKFSETNFSFQDFQNKEIWQQLFYEFLFEALGYTKNKGAMLKLAQFSNIAFLKNVCSPENNYLSIEACLFAVAGLLPEDKTDISSNDYLKNLRINWESFKTKYDGKYLSNTAWHFFKLRPQNFPTIRIAGGTVLIYKILFDNFLEKLFNKVEQIKTDEVIIKILRNYFVIRAAGFWKSHYVFEKESKNNLSYFIGISRADDIILNVVFPFISVYAEIFGKNETAKKILRIYSNYVQKDDNSIVKFVASSLEVNDLWQKSILSQGMIELFRSFCSKGKCLDCRIGQSIFN